MFVDWSKILANEKQAVQFRSPIVVVCEQKQCSHMPGHGDLLSYHPQIKFLGITFDNRMTFTKHFEEILERCNQKFHRLRILVNKKWGPSPETILQIYKQCVRPIYEYGIVSTMTVSETHHKNTKSPELFH